MKTPREKYNYDSHYHKIVDFMVAQIANANYTPSEMREAAVLASIIYEETRLRPNLNIPVTKDLEEALKIIREFTDANAQST